MTRAEAIDILKNTIVQFGRNNGKTVYAEALQMAIKALEEPQWIPCSERLPKKSGQYYVSGGDKVWICEFLLIPNFVYGWCNDGANPAVQAWMLPPEPYRMKGKENG